MMGWDGWIVSAHLETRAGKDVLADAGAFVLPNGPLLFPLPARELQKSQKPLTLATETTGLNSVAGIFFSIKLHSVVT